MHILASRVIACAMLTFVEQLSQLFDAVDDDHSGFLDFKEAATALKEWQKTGKDKYSEQSDKTRELAALKSKAGRLLQEALRPPEHIRIPDFSALPNGSSPTNGAAQSPGGDSAASPGGKSPGSPAGVRRAINGAAGGLGKIITPRKSPEKQAAEEAAKLRAQEAAKKALTFLVNQVCLPSRTF